MPQRPNRHTAKLYDTHSSPDPDSYSHTNANPYPDPKSYSYSLTLTNPQSIAQPRPVSFT